MSEDTRNNQQSVEEDNTSTIPQPQGQDPIGAERPSQAEGDRDTVEADLRDNAEQGQA